MDLSRNWSGNLKYSAADHVSPGDVPTLQQLVAQSPAVKALGTRHSFSSIADTEGLHISTNRLNRILSLTGDKGLVEVESGVRYGELSEVLHREGWSLANLASLPHISVAGACATATHGSGVQIACLAEAVAEVEIVLADGSLQLFRKGQPEFFGVVVSLGALGIATRLKLTIQPTFNVEQYVYERLPLSELEANFESVMGFAYSVSLFTTWQTDEIDQVWIKSTGGQSMPEQFFRARPAAGNRHPIACLSAENCTPQMGVAGPWHERLPHFRMGFTPSSGAEIQSEYLLPIENAVPAIQAIARLKSSIAPLLQISEVRTVAEDSHWMSPFYRRPSVGIHFTWIPDWTAVKALLPRIEEVLEPLGAIPHWAKLTAMPPAKIRAQFPRFRDFQNLMRDLDPAGKFQNPWLQNLG